MNSPYADLKIEKFSTLVNDLIGPEMPLALFTAEGSLVWTSCPTHPVDVPELLGAIAGARSSKRAATDVVLTAPSNGGSVLCRPLIANSEEDLGILSIDLPAYCSPQTLAKAGSLLDHIGRSILDEYALNLELNQMAEELGARYEELNLIYSVEEQAKKYDPESGRGVIDQLVGDCARYLDVDAVVFYICDEDFEIHHVGDQSFPVDEIWEELRQPLFRLVEENRTAIVLNHDRDRRWDGITHSRGLRVLAAPLVDVKGRIRGLLTILNRSDKPEFNNGQRRLIEVLAEQASSVLQANQDVLTGLLNRVGFEHRLGLLLPALAPGEQAHALLHVDLDRFQLVNDSAGHLAGDEILRQLATLLDAHTRNTDLVGRIGDDVFAVFLQGCAPDRAVDVVTKLLSAINGNRFWWGGKAFDLSVSVGIVPVASSRVDLWELMTLADTACSVAKERGGNGFQFYDEEDAELSRRHGQLQWVPRIKRALAENRFTLFAQPIVPVKAVPGPPHYEILLRFIDEQGEVVAPFGFIPAAERFQMMLDIDRWVVRETLRVITSADEHDWCCSINLSGQSLTTPGFLEYVREQPSQSGVSCERLCFEITETAAISNFSDAVQLITALKEDGCRFALDDFGSGLSSFGYLRNLPVDYLKIDGMFVKGMVEDPVSAEMVRCMAQLGRVVGLETVAEFVEDTRILEMLRDMQVDYAQGYGIGKPLPLDEQLMALASVKSREATYG